MSDSALLRRVWSNRQLRARLEADEANSGGSGSPGSPIVRKFPFAFDTPNLLTGAAVYTPTVGDLLLDAWIEIDTAWDGTTPKGDFGVFLADYSAGLFGNLVSNGSIDMTNSDGPFDDGGGVAPFLQGYGGISLLTARTVLAVFGVWGTPPIPSTPFPARSTFDLIVQQQPLQNLGRWVPGKFTDAIPWKVVVSQDGTPSGADPGSTQGSAVLYLVTATPV